MCVDQEAQEDRRGGGIERYTRRVRDEGQQASEPCSAVTCLMGAELTIVSQLLADCVQAGDPRRRG